MCMDNRFYEYKEYWLDRLLDWFWWEHGYYLFVGAAYAAAAIFLVLWL